MRNGRDPGSRARVLAPPTVESLPPQDEQPRAHPEQEQTAQRQPERGQGKAAAGLCQGRCLGGRLHCRRRLEVTDADRLSRRLQCQADIERSQRARGGQGLVDNSPGTGFPGCGPVSRPAPARRTAVARNATRVVAVFKRLRATSPACRRFAVEPHARRAPIARAARSALPKAAAAPVTSAFSSAPDVSSIASIPGEYRGLPGRRRG